MNQWINLERIASLRLVLREGNQSKYRGFADKIGDKVTLIRSINK
jgi:hypothetical protein